MPDRTCSADGCERSPYARGLCKPHYLQWYRHNQSDKTIRRTNPGAVCSVTGCVRPALARGLCRMHYKRLMKNGLLELRPSMRAAAPPGSRWCSLCKSYQSVASFQRGNGWCKSCCRRERKRRYREDPALRQAARARARLRKSRLRGARRSDRFTSEEIAERDGWRCQICRKLINPRWRWPHGRSLSIDHIVPIAEGGDDVKSNVQAAHLACNVSKSVGGVDQLRLIG